MGDINHNFSGILKKIIGLRLCCVQGQFYVMEDFLSDEPLSICLVFDTGLNVKISGLSDGESIVVDEGGLCSYSMQDAGAVIVNDIDRMEKLCGDSRVCAVNFIVGEEGKIIGVKVVFSKSSIYFVNLGDELKIFDFFPDFLFEEESCRLVDICY
ncbi:hypothetical protein [Paludibacterium paludis]|uniref:Uncharacterized protein n=1 Tax=Paludibacterium paludis TaxID=1225769 RepID=A0A918P3S0_9NEIS|nr:hypothetical protein [Paludibacterium paludis]GGY17816.1 hypothetical protein GCM10011289_21690 [Paludibacterium paludis]